MQSGFARLVIISVMNITIKPDLICVGKGMGGGYPISGVIGKNVMDLPEIGSMIVLTLQILYLVLGMAVLDEIRKKLTYQAKKREKFYLKNYQI